MSIGNPVNQKYIYITATFRQSYAYSGSNVPGLDRSGHIMKKGR